MLKLLLIFGVPLTIWWMPLSWILFSSSAAVDVGSEGTVRFAIVLWYLMGLFGSFRKREAPEEVA